MRPPQFAGERLPTRLAMSRSPGGFNEAPAVRGGKAGCGIRRRLRRLASMRPPQFAGERLRRRVLLSLGAQLQ